MNNLKFRGWRKDMGGFLYFSILSDANKYFSDKDIIMQFTGVIDIEGKEIYAGDLLENNCNFISEVKYSNKKACFYLDRIGKDGRLYKDKKPQGDKDLSQISLITKPKVLEYKIKIIGNIFEDELYKQNHYCDCGFCNYDGLEIKTPSL